MKALRYLLMAVAIMGVLSVSAQTPKYGKPYNPSNESSVYGGIQTQMPTATMSSTSSTLVTSGSTLPISAITGTSTTYESNGSRRIGAIRTGTWNPGGGEEPGPDEGDNSEPWEDPIGDAVWPLLALAAVYAVLRVYRRKRGL